RTSRTSRARSDMGGPSDSSCEATDPAASHTARSGVRRSSRTRRAAPAASVGSAAMAAVTASTSAAVPDARRARSARSASTWAAASSTARTAASASPVRRLVRGSGTRAGIRTTTPAARPGLAGTPVSLSLVIRTLPTGSSSSALGTLHASARHDEPPRGRVRRRGGSPAARPRVWQDGGMAEALMVTSPVAGRVVAMRDVPDPVFAECMVGPGLAVDPDREAGAGAVAPCAGVVVKLHPHAFVLLAPSGDAQAAEGSGRGVLVHLGIDTVQLEGEGFTLLAAEGDTVEAGQELV